MRPKKVPGLGPYGVAFYPDLPLKMTEQLFKEQVAVMETGEFHEKTIFTKTLSKESTHAPSWLLFFTTFSYGNYNCRGCIDMANHAQKVASELQMERPELNIMTATINCDERSNSRSICDYFKIAGLPHLIVLRPDLGKYFDMWRFDGFSKTHTMQGILDFALEDHAYAYSQGQLPKGGKTSTLTGLIRAY